MTELRCRVVKIKHSRFEPGTLMMLVGLVLFTVGLINNHAFWVPLASFAAGGLVVLILWWRISGLKVRKISRVTLRAVPE